MAVVRVREHVNPLNRRFSTPAAPPPWSTLYRQGDRPLHLDIGCAKGRFVQQMAQVTPEWNYLGLEIREPLVDQANQWAQELGLTNLHYLFCNANNSLRSILQDLPQGLLQRVTIQFPDPWFKNRHHKRRVVQPQLVEEVAEFLAPQGWVFLQSDILPVAQEMRDRFAAHAAFALTQAEWLTENPLPVRTERETSVMSRGEPVYRTLLIRH